MPLCFGASMLCLSSLESGCTSLSICCRCLPLGEPKREPYNTNKHSQASSRLRHAALCSSTVQVSCM